MHKACSVRSLRGSDLVAVGDTSVVDPIMPPSCCDELEDEILVIFIKKYLKLKV